MRSKTLQFTLLLVVLLTKPKPWVLSGFGFLCLSISKWFFDGQAIYLKHWREIFNGMLNTSIPIEQKLFLIGFFCFLVGASLFFVNLVKLVAVEQYRRFGIKPNV